MSTGVTVAVIERLETLEKSANNGRGFSACRSLIFALQHDSLDTARAIVNNEWDKFRNYPEIVYVVKSAGLAPEHWI